jgi:hypothetical protein
MMQLISNKKKYPGKQTRAAREKNNSKTSCDFYIAATVLHCHPSFIQTLLSVPEFHRVSSDLSEVADFTADREFHPALKNVLIVIPITIRYKNSDFKSPLTH